MRCLSIILLYTAFVGTVYSQNSINRSYKLLSELNWDSWANFDTANCLNNRMEYYKYFDSIFVKGIRQDSVEKYLGKGLSYLELHKWSGKRSRWARRLEEYTYYLTWDCFYHAGARELVLTYKHGKLKSVSKNKTNYYQ